MRKKRTVYPSKRYVAIAAPKDTANKFRSNTMSYQNLLKVRQLQFINERRLVARNL